MQEINELMVTHCRQFMPHMTYIYNFFFGSIQIVIRNALVFFNPIIADCYKPKNKFLIHHPVIPDTVCGRHLKFRELCLSLTYVCCRPLI